MRPLLNRAMRSERFIASSWSWVTKTKVEPTSRWMRRISICSAPRRLRSRAPSGSSSSSAVRVEDDRPGEGDPLLLSAGELGRVVAVPAGELHELEHLGDPAGDLRLRQLALAQRVGDVLGDRHVREQRVVLEEHAEVALVRRQGADVGRR